MSNLKTPERKTGFSYIRVSRQREGMITVETQDNKINKFCSLHEINLVGKYQDVDFSGRKAKRPDFQEMLSSVQNKKTKPHYILVYKLDRFSRSVQEFYQFMSILNDHNVDLISITQHFDTSTPIGRAMMGILIMFAQLESELTGERVKDNLQNNAERGRWNGRNLPLGYQWDKDERLLKSYPLKSQIVQMIFEEYTRGTRTYALADKLNDMKIKSPSGNGDWSPSSIIYILKNPVYVGKIRHNNKVYNGKHEAIISEPIFKKANKLLEERAESRNNGNTYMLSILTYCKSCGSYGHSKINGPTGYKKRRYLCGNRNNNTKKACDTPLLDALSLEKAIEKTIFQMASNPTTFEKIKEQSKENNSSKTSYIYTRSDKLGKEIKKIDKALNKLYEDYYINEIIPQTQFETFSLKYEAQKEELLNEMEMLDNALEYNKATVENINIIQEGIVDLKENWEYLDNKEKNIALKAIINRIEFDHKTVQLDLIYTKIKIPVKRQFRGTMYF